MTLTELIQQHAGGSPQEVAASAWMEQEKHVHPFFPLPHFAQAKTSGTPDDLQVAALYAPQRHLLRNWMQGSLPEMIPHPARPFAATIAQEVAKPHIVGEPFAILNFAQTSARTITPVLSICKPLRHTETTPYINSLIQIKLSKYKGLAATIRHAVKDSAKTIVALQPIAPVAESMRQATPATLLPQPTLLPTAQPESQPRRKIRRQETAQLLDHFLETNPTIGRSYSPYNEVQTPANVQRSVEEDDEIVTETLARIYERQGKLAEAIAIYKKLCLLFPKKQAYFEGKIQQLNTV